MGLFDDRQKAQESRFAHDADLRFKATSRRNKLVGAWAAQKLGLSGSAAEDYVAAVVRADFQQAGDEDVIGKLVADLAGLADRREIEAALAECMTKAVAEADATRAAGN